MKIGIFGTGQVGTTLGTKLVSLGHEVKLGSRESGNPKAVEWAGKAGAKASAGTFAQAAAFGELLFNCTSGMASLEALKAAGAANLKGKVLLDVANALDFSKGMPPTLTVSNTDSLGEQIQRAFPECKVVKTLNTMNCEIMVNPGRVKGDHDVFVSGNDKEAKGKAVELLRTFGWKNIVDLGDISTARGTEMYLPLWLRLWGSLQTGDFNIHVAK
jgi:predicted dinucleotide-binding enzyme